MNGSDCAGDVAGNHAGNIAAELLARLADQGTRPSIIGAGPRFRRRTTTAAELLEAVEHWREAVDAVAAGHGLQPGDRVVLQTEPGPVFVAATLALMLEDLVPVAADVEHGDDVYRDRISFARPAAVAVSPLVAALQRRERLRRRLASSGRRVPPPIALPTVTAEPGPRSAHRSARSARSGSERSRPRPGRAGEDPAFIVFTGGTTSHPRGVVLSHRALAAYLDGLNQIPEWSAIGSMVADQPQQILYGLAHGKIVHLVPGGSRRAAAIAHRLYHDGADAYFGSPATHLEMLETGLHRTARNLPRALLLGGAPVTPALLRRLIEEVPASVALRCLYGMTEVGLVAHCSAVEKLAWAATAAAADGDVVDGDVVGHLLDGVEATVVDGELTVRTPSRSSGYLGDPPAGPDEPFATGDRATLMADGERTLVVLGGRAKNMLVVGGVNLYPGQYEPRLELVVDEFGHRWFEAVALVGAPAGWGDETPVLCFVPAARGNGTGASGRGEAEVLARIEPVFGPGLAPSRALAFERFPTTGRQRKLDRTQLALDVQARLGGAAGLLERRRHLFAQLADRGRSRPVVAAADRYSRQNLERALALPAAPPPPTLYILGHQRSGTTLVQRRLAAGPDATAMALVDLLAPHPRLWQLRVSDRAPLRALGPISRRLGTQLLRLDRLAAIDAVHPLSLTGVEEDELLLAALGLSGITAVGLAGDLSDPDLAGLRGRTDWDDRELDALIEVHDRVVARWRQVQIGAGLITGDTTQVVKNPAFGPLAGRLAARHPDARFVVLLRHPLEAMASRLDLVARVRGRTLSPDDAAVIAADSVAQLEGLAVAVTDIDDDRLLTVAFADVVADPAATVAGIAAFAGLGHPAVASWSPEPHRRHQPRRLAVERFGLDPDRLLTAVPGYLALLAGAGAGARRPAEPDRPGSNASPRTDGVPR